MKKTIISIGASLILCFTIFLNFNQYSQIHNADIALSELLVVNTANAETWPWCDTCYMNYYFCTVNFSYQYNCQYGGIGCSTIGQPPC